MTAALDLFTLSSRQDRPDWERLHREADALAAELLPTLRRPACGPTAWIRKGAAVLTGWG
ncbi:MAG: hypothetical protein GY898_07560 [Proteobacteria bacterium]|nr:hypothetical protein [Pseudomonadota bacterium]